MWTETKYGKIASGKKFFKNKDLIQNLQESVENVFSMLLLLHETVMPSSGKLLSMCLTLHSRLTPLTLIC